MRTGKRFLLAVASLFFPGVGHAVARRTWSMLAWALGSIAVPFSMLLLPWMGWPTLALRLACAVATFRVLGRPLSAPPADLPPPAVIAGRNPEPRQPPRARPLVITAIVIGVIGGGAVKASIQIVRVPAASMVPTVQVGDQVIVNELTYRWRGPRRGDVAMFRHPCGTQMFLKRVVALGGQTVEVRCGQLYVDGAAVPTRLVSTDCAYVDRVGDEPGREVSCSEYAEADYRVYQTAGHPEEPRDEPGDFPELFDDAPPSCAKDSLRATPEQTNQQPGRIVQTTETLDPDACTPQMHYVVPDGHVFVLGDNRPNSADSRFWGSVPVENLRGSVVGTWRRE